MVAQTEGTHTSALRFFFTVTLDRPDLSRKLALVRQSPSANVRMFVGMSESVAVFVTVRVVNSSMVKTFVGPVKTGAEFTSLTVTVIVFVALN